MSDKIFGLPIQILGESAPYRTEVRFTDEKYNNCPKFCVTAVQAVNPDKPTPMDPGFKWDWIKALRSGNYKQATGALAVMFQLKEEMRYCCLGVVCELKHIPALDSFTSTATDVTTKMFHGETNYLPEEVAEEIRLSRENQRMLATLNDAGWSFSQIADFIEEVF